MPDHARPPSTVHRPLSTGEALSTVHWPLPFPIPVAAGILPAVEPGVSPGGVPPPSTVHRPPSSVAEPSTVHCLPSSGDAPSSVLGPQSSSQPPASPIDLLFIHHSCGGQWLAPVGPPEGANAICKSDPNGGNLRALLQQQGYHVHEAAYGSRLGQNTDLFDWLPKFSDHMDAILRCAHQDEVLPPGQTNRVVMFKSCFPNNAFRAEGRAPGNPSGPELTVWNAKAAYQALLKELQKRPDVLFVCVTAPPLAPKQQPQPLWRQLARRLKGSQNDLNESARLARQFNNWLSDAGGWLRDYPLRNAVVFDYFDILTGHGASNLSVYPTGAGFDSHPSSEGNTKAAAAFVPFLNRAVRRAGLLPQQPAATAPLTTEHQ